MKAHEILVPDDLVDERVDRLVARELGISRRYAVRLINRGSIRIAGSVAQKGTLLRPGETLEVSAFRHPDEGPPPNPTLRLPLLAQNESLLAFDKPAGMPSLPLDFEEDGTAVNAAIAQYPELASVGERGLEAGLIHRLDTETSGVLVFARTNHALDEARSAVSAGLARKEYRARVTGVPKPQRIELPLRESGRRMRVVTAQGRPSITDLLAVYPDDDGFTSLVDVLLITGLRHQIRVALAELGHPIVGDLLYGSAPANAKTGRHWLHATRFVFGDFEAQSAPPAELRRANE